MITSKLIVYRIRSDFAVMYAFTWLMCPVIETVLLYFLCLRSFIYMNMNDIVETCYQLSSTFEGDRRSERDKLDGRRSAKLTIPATIDS